MDLENCDVVVVGSGLFGSVISERLANILDKQVVVIEKRSHIGGNCYSETEKETGINYHVYGTHIFHTSNEKVWNYISNFAQFNNYRHQVLTTYKNKVYQMPVNLETINSFYNLNLRPYEVKDFLKKEIRKEELPHQPKNFEEKAISLIGRNLYDAFIKGYTIKQWQKHPRDMPESILNRLPFRTNYNECYFLNAKWEGIPIGGYTPIFKKLLSNKKIKVHTGVDFFNVKHLIPKNKIIIYSGPIDKYFDYKFGALDWRTLVFEKEIHNYDDFQGTSVMNYAEKEIPYTRIHEPKHLHPEKDYNLNKTLTIKEYSKRDNGNNPYYPINDQRNQNLILKYREEIRKQKDLFICGRLGDYKYYDMDKTIEMALNTFTDLKKKFIN